MGIDRDVVAHHEAGHAVAAHVLGVNVERVAIQSEGDAAGHVVHDYGCNMNEIIYEEEPDRQWALERAAIISLAGEIAQRRFRAESVEEAKNPMHLALRFWNGLVRSALVVNKHDVVPIT